MTVVPADNPEHIAAIVTPKPYLFQVDASSECTCILSMLTNEMFDRAEKTACCYGKQTKP